MPAPGPIETLAAPADALCLDFANTRSWRGTATPTEDLATPADLLRWCLGAGTAPPDRLAALAACWERAPGKGEAGHAEAVALREAIFRLFAASAAGAAPAAEDVAALNRALAAAPPRARLCPDAAGGWRWAAPVGDAGLPALLAPVLWSAGDLLAGPRRARVRQCANPRCGWVFLDDSKGGNRRWCSMASCGNRAKAHRHYARRKSATPA